MPGRPRKPTALKKLQGTLQPCRTNQFEPVPVGVLGQPPSGFNQQEMQAWTDISESIAPGVATNCDWILVEALAREIARHRSGEITGAGLSFMRWGISQLGMSPADRSKIVVGDGQKKKPRWTR